MTDRTGQSDNELARLQARVHDLSSLIQVTNIISSTLDLDRVLGLVMEKAQEVMHAEASSIFLVNEEQQTLECQVALGSHGDKISKVISLEKGQGVAGWVWERREPQIVPDVSKDDRFYSNIDQQSGFQTKSILAVPLEFRDRLIGVAEVVNRCDGKEFTDYDLDLFTTFCRQVALAIENARVHKMELEAERLRQQLESANEIQQSFMPQTLPQGEKDLFSISARNLPAISVGGDFYDVLMIDDRHLGILIGDVSGKGIPAALYMARLMSDFRFFVQKYRRPSVLLKKMNPLLVDRSRHGMFVTLQFALLDIKTGKVVHGDAGHLPLIRLTDNDADLLPLAAGPPLGVLKEITFGDHEMNLSPGDFLVFYTDGIIEAKNNHSEEFTSQKLVECLKRSWDSPEQVVNHCLQRVKSFAQTSPQSDDITIVVVQWKKPC